MHAVPHGQSAGSDCAAAPEVYPISGATDLRGAMPVRLRAQDRDLVAYGFGGQRITILAARIGAVYVHRGWGKRWGRNGPALVILDKDGRVLLRAPGTWGASAATTTRPARSSITIFNGLVELCRSLGIDRPSYLTTREVRRQQARWQRAPGYHRLRVRSRVCLGTRLALALLDVVLAGFGIAAAMALASLLPWGIGAARNLAGVLLGVAAVLAAWWLYGFELRVLRWLAVSLHVRTLAPPDRFFGAAHRRRDRRARTLLTFLMVLGIPALIGWGPVVGLISLTKGFADQALVASLRQHGATAAGYVIDVPTYSTDSSGNTVVTDHPTLLFLPPGGASVVRTPDPPIGGRTWPMNPQRLVTIVYDPADPSTAAVAGQISGSPWHGAPTGNIVSGALLTVALVPLTWLTARRIRDARRESREGFFEGLA